MEKKSNTYEIVDEYFAEKKKAEALGIKTNDIIGHGGWNWGKDSAGNETGWKQPIAFKSRKNNE